MIDWNNLMNKFKQNVEVAPEAAIATISPGIWINEIVFSDASKVSFSKNDITVVVGPNNAGKSASLREAAALLRHKPNEGVVIRDITIAQSGSDESVNSFLSRLSKRVREHRSEILQGFGYTVDVYNVQMYWTGYRDGLGSLLPVFAHTLNTEDRLTASNPAENISLTKEPSSHPIHFLQRNDELEQQFSDYFRQAFGMDLIVHRNAGKNVPLYVGEKPVLKDGEDRVSVSYMTELEKLDLLHHQGDGMRSFVGVLLNAFISHHSIVFVDEPEAFLHPPQARLLGKMLAKNLPSERQLFLSTHSEDFLKGLLDADPPNLKIIRLQRDGAVNRASVLDSADIKAIWSDSLLRHSNILNGLFHSKVVVCESDSDCRFYSAVLFAIYEGAGLTSPDILFTHCGGKHRIPTVIKSLVKLNVPVRVITDFDVLNDENPLKPIYEEMGGLWKDVVSDWKAVKTSIDKKRPELEREALRGEIDAIFASTTEKIMPKSKVTDIQKLLTKASPWAHAKEVGKSFVPSGDPTNALDRLLERFRGCGVHIVEVGQLESFVKSHGNHGPKWVNEVMQKDLKSDSELESARCFIQRVIQ